MLIRTKLSLPCCAKLAQPTHEISAVSACEQQMQGEIGEKRARAIASAMSTCRLSVGQ